MSNFDFFFLIRFFFLVLSEKICDRFPIIQIWEQESESVEAEGQEEEMVLEKAKVEEVKMEVEKTDRELSHLVVVLAS